MKRIFINVGFITNSSSVVHWFPRRVLEHPDVKAFLEAYELTGGYVGSDLWHREHCSSFLVTGEQFTHAQAIMTDNEFGGHGPNLGSAEDDVVVIFGDEYSNITSALCNVLVKACENLGLDAQRADEYN